MGRKLHDWIASCSVICGWLQPHRVKAIFVRCRRDSFVTAASVIGAGRDERVVMHPFFITIDFLNAQSSFINPHKTILLHSSYPKRSEVHLAALSGLKNWTRCTDDRCVRIRQFASRFNHISVHWCCFWTKSPDCLPQWTSTLRCPCVSLRLPSPWTCAWTLTNSSSSSSRCPSSLHLVSSRLASLGLVRLVAWEALRCATSSYSRSFWHWSRSSRSSGRYSSPSSSDSTSSCLGNMRPSCRSTLRFVDFLLKV